MILRGRLQKKQLATRLILLALVVLIIMIVIGLAGELINKRRVKEKISDLEQQINQTQSENFELNTLIGSWEGGSQLEKEARSKLGLKKEGERVILINKSSGSQPAVVAAALDPDILNPAKAIEKIEPGNPAKWWRYFFK